MRPVGARNDSVILAGLSVQTRQLSNLVGGGDAARPTGEGKEKRLCPLFLRDKGANPLRYHSNSGKFSGARFAVSGGPGVSY